MNSYLSMAAEMFDTVGQAIGIHVMLLVTEHALWKTRQTYEEASLIGVSEGGIKMDELSSLGTERANVIAREFVMSVIATLSRLVGKQLAQQLTDQIRENELIREG